MVTRHQIATIDVAVRCYEIRSNALPASLAQLCVGTADSPVMLKREFLEDPWRKPIRYRITSTNSYEIRSSGPDMIMDTADDLTNRSRASKSNNR